MRSSSKGCLTIHEDVMPLGPVTKAVSLHMRMLCHEVHQQRLSHHMWGCYAMSSNSCVSKIIFIEHISLNLQKIKLYISSRLPSSMEALFCLVCVLVIHVSSIILYLTSQRAHLSDYHWPNSMRSQEICTQLTFLTISYALQYSIQQ